MATPLQGEVVFIKSDNNRFYTSGDPDWEKPDIQSDSWQEFDRLTRAHEYRGLFWMTFDVDLEVKNQPILDWEYNLHMLAAQEVYWDGQLLGANGKPAATKEDEIPGVVWTTYLIPNDLITDGKHTIKIFGSNHHRLSNMKFLREGWIRPFDPNFRYVSFWSLVPSLLVSIAAIIGLYFLMLYFTEGRQVDHLVFFFLLESLTIYGFAIQWDHLVGYTYDWEPFNLALEYVGGISVLVLLPLYFLIKHEANRPWAWLLGTIALTVLLDQFIDLNNLAWFASFGLALFASLYFGKKNNNLLWWESLGLTFCIIALLQQDMEDVFMYFPTLFALVLLTHAMTMQRRKKALQEANYLETQLRAELLRKHIQPHFLLNTLTSLMEWVETDVDKSTEFIAELAEEFRLMSQVSSKPLIPLETEISLCKKHLAIMSLRLQKDCLLQTHNIRGDEVIPPAIFHTLLENAFSHNAYSGSEISFTLSKSDGARDETQFKFTCPRAKEHSDKFRKIGTGTGKKYIEARLSQAFGKYWKLEENSTNDEWCTVITVHYDRLKLPVDSRSSTKLSEGS